LYSYKAPDPTATPETPPVPESNQIPNCIEGGKDEAGNNVCKVCAEGYELTDGQCSKIQESSEESGT